MSQDLIAVYVFGGFGVFLLVFSLYNFAHGKAFNGRRGANYFYRNIDKSFWLLTVFNFAMTFIFIVITLLLFCGVIHVNNITGANYIRY